MTQMEFLQVFLYQHSSLPWPHSGWGWFSTLRAFFCCKKFLEDVKNVLRFALRDSCISGVK